jgi:hypothetical protein
MEIAAPSTMREFISGYFVAGMASNMWGTSDMNNEQRKQHTDNYLSRHFKLVEEYRAALPHPPQPWVEANVDYAYLDDDSSSEDGEYGLPSPPHSRQISRHNSFELPERVDTHSFEPPSPTISRTSTGSDGILSPYPSDRRSWKSQAKRQARAQRVNKQKPRKIMRLPLEQMSVFKTSLSLSRSNHL